MKISSRKALVVLLLLSAGLNVQAQEAELKVDEATALAGIANPAEVAVPEVPVDRISQQELTSIQNFQLQAQNIRLQMQVLNRQLGDVSAAQQAYVESVFNTNQRGPEWTINTQSGGWEKKEDLQTADASALVEEDAAQ